MHVDNVGDIFLTEKTFLFQSKNQINVHHHLIHDYVEGRAVKINFFCSEENMADSFKNNRSNGTFESITSRYLHHE